MTNRESFSKIRRAGGAGVRALRLYEVPALLRHGLRESGWLRSSVRGRPVDAAGNPIPWYTYGAISFLESRLSKSLTVFEFGAGHSTLWYAGRVGRIYTVEHDRRWLNWLKTRLPANAQLALAENERDYAAAVARDGVQFDVIAIDGYYPWRAACAGEAVKQLLPTGVLVWDNSEREDFAEALSRIDALAGFRELRFSGFGPCGARTWSTSVLYRAENCLGI